MTRRCGISLVLTLTASSACLAIEGAGEPQVATVTGEIRNPLSRELTFTYGLPSALEESRPGGRARQSGPLRLRGARRPRHRGQRAL